MSWSITIYLPSWVTRDMPTLGKSCGAGLVTTSRYLTSDITIRELIFYYLTTFNTITHKTVQLCIHMFRSVIQKIFTNCS